MRRIFYISVEEFRPGNKWPSAVVELRKNYYLFGIKIYSKNKKGGNYEVGNKRL